MSVDCYETIFFACSVSGGTLELPTALFGSTKLELYHDANFEWRDI